MGLGDDLEKRTSDIFHEHWDTVEGYVVPDPEDIGMGNKGRYLDATVLYADLARSTELVTEQPAEFAAEIYKAFLYASARIINAQRGKITSYDGDRIMAVFVGKTKNTDAMKTGLHINYVVKNIMVPKMKEVYENTDFVPQHGVGIDTGTLLVARTGVRKYNDLVWVGRAANYAAKLSDIRNGNYRTWITKDVYDVALDKAKLGSNDAAMWKRFTWSKMNNAVVYGSTWSWKVS